MNGDSGKPGKQKFEAWYAKITSFNLSTRRQETEEEEEEVVDVSDSKEASAGILWFHHTRELSAALLVGKKTPEQISLKAACVLDKDINIYLMGAGPDSINIDTILRRR